MPSRAKRSIAGWPRARRRVAGASGEAPGGDPETRSTRPSSSPAAKLVIDALKVLDKGGTVAMGGIYSSPVPPIEYP